MTTPSLKNFQKSLQCQSLCGSQTPNRKYGVRSRADGVGSADVAGKTCVMGVSWHAASMCDGYRCHASTSSWLRIPQTYHPHGCFDLFPSRLVLALPPFNSPAQLRCAYLFHFVLPHLHFPPHTVNKHFHRTRFSCTTPPLTTPATPRLCYFVPRTPIPSRLPASKLPPTTKPSVYLGQVWPHTVNKHFHRTRLPCTTPPLTTPATPRLCYFVLRTSYLVLDHPPVSLRQAKSLPTIGHFISRNSNSARP